MAWTLEYSGTEKSLADWGISDCDFDWNNLAADVVTLKADGRDLDAADLFAYGSTIIIRQNRSGSGTTWSGGSIFFYGRVEPWNREGAMDEENHFGRLVNPWWYLERLIYQWSIQVFAGWSGGVPGGTPTFNTVTTPRVVLNLELSGGIFNSITVGQQIANVLQYAIDQGAPIQIGNIACWATGPSEFVKNITCAEVIQRMFRTESDFVIHWDYTTTPPTIHFLKAGTVNLDPSLTAVEQAPLQLTPVTIDLNDGDWIERLQIRPRPDWQKSYVKINYDQINTVDGAEYLSISEDHWPDPIPSTTEDKFNGVDLYFDLVGLIATTNSEQATIISDSFDVTDPATWKKWKPELNDDHHYSSVVVVGAATTPASSTEHPAPTIEALDEYGSGGASTSYNSSNAYELLDGSLPDWLASQGISFQKVRATAWVYTTSVKGEKKWKQVTHDFTAINVNTAHTPVTRYSTWTTVAQVAETPPSSLAKIMYQAWQSLAVEGTITAFETEVALPVNRNNCLNFVATGSVDWSAVNALVQKVSGSLLRGATQIQFGAPLQITANDLIDLMRVARQRQPAPNINFLLGGPLSAGTGSIQAPRKVTARSAQHGAELHNVAVVASDPDGSSNSWNMVQDSNNDSSLPAIIVQKVDSSNSPIASQPGIQIKIADLNTPVPITSGTPGQLTLALREMDYCDAGTTYKVIVACTEYYTP